VPIRPGGSLLIMTVPRLVAIDGLSKCHYRNRSLQLVVTIITIAWLNAFVVTDTLVVKITAGW
jgi:hypothetical protein